MTEKSILAYFNSLEEAEGAARKLQALRATYTSIDRSDHHLQTDVDETIYPIHADFSNLDQTSFDTNDFKTSDASLSSVTQNASGISDRNEVDLRGKNLLLKAVMPEETFRQGLEVVKQAGGFVESIPQQI